MKQSETEIQTDRLTLRRAGADDMHWIRPLADNFDVAKNLCSMPHPYDQNAADEFAGLLSQWRGSNTDFDFGIWQQNGMGVIGIHHRGKSGWQTGYWLGEEYWRQGFATEALQAIVAFGFNTLKAERLWADVYIDNPASEHVLRKAGFRQTGKTAPHPCLARGMDIEAHLLDYRRSDWLKDQGKRRS